jgi:hypothetical protein
MITALARNSVLIAVLSIAGAEGAGPVPPQPDSAQGETKNATRDPATRASGNVATGIPPRTAASGFHAYYTRLPFDDDNNTGKYADVVVNLGETGQLVFSREFGYLPFWQTSDKQHFVGEPMVL